MSFSKKEYKVRLRGRSAVIYEEGERKAILEAEMMAGPTDLVIYLESLRCWQPPYENEVLSSEDKQRIKENITKELEAKGLNIVWEYS
ncbi:MAG TPA: Imm74 family immunity protein [Candidatus Aquicultor sp.]